MTRVATALRTETGLARIALGIAALHAADDNFFQPEAGTSAGDHLVGGLLQVGLFLAFAWGYPRMRPGLRGTLAVFVGLFVVSMGVGEAGYYTREDGPSGDDYTGLLAIPAGALLAGIGLVTLWKSRKGGSIVRRYSRRALLALGFLLGLALVLYPFAESYVITHSSRAFVPTPNLGTAYEDVSFRTSDGLRLVGWYVPSKNGSAVISSPGRKGSRDPARLLASHGYGVLLFDRRGEGESEGDPNLLGWQGHRDIAAAIDFLQTRPEVDDERIGGVGLSVGGEMMIEEAAQNDELKAIVSEGAGIRSSREAIHLDGAGKIAYSWIFGVTTIGTALWTSNRRASAGTGPAWCYVRIDAAATLQCFRGAWGTGGAASRKAE